MSSKALSTRAVDAEISSEIVRLRSIPLKTAPSDNNPVTPSSPENVEQTSRQASLNSHLPWSLMTYSFEFQIASSQSFHTVIQPNKIESITISDGHPLKLTSLINWFWVSPRITNSKASFDTWFAFALPKLANIIAPIRLQNLKFFFVITDYPSELTSNYPGKPNRIFNIKNKKVEQILLCRFDLHLSLQVVPLDKPAQASDAGKVCIQQGDKRTSLSKSSVARSFFRNGLCKFSSNAPS